MKNVLFQGAEAILTRENSIIVKNRIKKSYRIPQIDEKLRRQRTRKEIKILEKTSKLIPVPKVISYSEESNIIKMEYINGKKLSDHLDKMKNAKKVSEMIGKNIAILHNNNIIHGDLTTSNMIYSKNKIYFIDFGLSFESNKIEDKAVDLHLIKEALEAKHFKNANKLFKAILNGYKISKYCKETLKRLEKVELRGRYKQQY